MQNGGQHWLTDSGRKLSETKDNFLTHKLKKSQGGALSTSAAWCLNDNFCSFFHSFFFSLSLSLFLFLISVSLFLYSHPHGFFCEEEAALSSVLIFQKISASTRHTWHFNLCLMRKKRCCLSQQSYRSPKELCPVSVSWEKTRKDQYGPSLHFHGRWSVALWMTAHSMSHSVALPKSNAQKERHGKSGPPLHLGNETARTKPTTRPLRMLTVRGWVIGEAACFWELLYCKIAFYLELNSKVTGKIKMKSNFTEINVTKETTIILQWKARGLMVSGFAINPEWIRFIVSFHFVTCNLKTA